MAIQVSTTDYRWNHGATPRGTGCWIFILHLTGGQPSETFRAAPDQTFTQAKKEALARGRERGAMWIEVAS